MRLRLQDSTELYIINPLLCPCPGFPRGGYFGCGSLTYYGYDTVKVEQMLRLRFSLRSKDLKSSCARLHFARRRPPSFALVICINERTNPRMAPHRIRLLPSFLRSSLSKEMITIRLTPTGGAHTCPEALQNLISGIWIYGICLGCSLQNKRLSSRGAPFVNFSG